MQKYGLKLQRREAKTSSKCRYLKKVFVLCYFLPLGIIYGFWLMLILMPAWWSETHRVVLSTSLSLFSASDSGYKRTWQQVKVKHKNIVQTGQKWSWSSRRQSSCGLSSHVCCLPLQLRGGGRRYWGRTAARPPRRWCLPRTTSCSTETHGSGWTSCLVPPALSLWLDLTPLSSMVCHTALWLVLADDWGAHWVQFRPMSL